MNQLDMKGRNAIVTGGASGIGLAICRRLVQSGEYFSWTFLTPKDPLKLRINISAEMKVWLQRGLREK